MKFFIILAAIALILGAIIASEFTSGFQGGASPAPQTATSTASEEPKQSTTPISSSTDFRGPTGKPGQGFRGPSSPPPNR